MKLLVHIGPHKTGTTAIQSTACEANSELLKIGIYYPVNLMKRYGEQHSEIAFLIQRRRITQVAQVMRRAAHRARQRRAHTVFVSGEEFCSLSPSEIASFRTICRRYFSSLSFVAVARTERKRIVSNFKHFLRHDSLRTEESFIAKSWTNIQSIIPMWQRYFSSYYQVLTYEDLSSQFVPNFFSRLFGTTFVTNRNENFSFDFLTLQIINVFLKDWKSPEIEALLWRYACKYKYWPKFPIENEIEKMLVPRLSSEMKVNFANQYPNSEMNLPVPSYDPIEICTRMLDLFTELRQHFQEVGSDSQ